MTALLTKKHLSRRTLLKGASVKLAGGRHIALPQATPLSNLHLSVLGLAGIEQQTFGDSTGSIAL
jgi:hypothetical protein